MSKCNFAKISKPVSFVVGDWIANGVEVESNGASWTGERELFT